MSNQHYFIFETTSGFCGIAWSDAGITRFQLPAKSAEVAERMMRRRASGAESGVPNPMVGEAVAAARRYFGGNETDFAQLDLDLDGQDEFFKRVYAAVRRIKWGRTTTYGTLASELGGGQETAQEVGQAMANNPIPLIIPCHRVLAAGGKIGGFSAPGGAATKIRMLNLEGVQVRSPIGEQASFRF
ncbi:MAG: methylated-DNA--[protein]-cysteine S-methyltransferase [Hyphomicrobiaceae bacterium]|nr:methylated-DNA--[protein]-cysteine S-methyltransferase [Hyphomicrobiaceae bacterium]